MSKELFTISRNTAEDYAEKWQRCRPEDLPGLFYAYDETERQGERLVTFSLDSDALKEFYDGISDKSTLEFIVHLGMVPENLPVRIPEEPSFILFVEAREKKGKLYEKCFPLKWAPNARFTNGQKDDPNSGINAIPAASAYMFVMSWMEMPEKDLALPFTAVSHVLGKRVKNYRFSNAESVSIYEDIERSLKSVEPRLDIHLGNGLAVYDHPFSFRPVIEVRNAVPVDENKLPIEPILGSRLTTGQINGFGDSFYDFGHPEPPPHEG